MKKILFLSILVLILATLFLSVYKAGSPNDLRYKNPALSVEERIESLLSQMTLEEKIGQMALVETESIHNTKDISRYGLGGLLMGGGGKAKDNTPQGWKTLINGYSEASRSSRLGIPILFGIDAIHGLAGVSGATIFPHAIGLGATHNPKLVRKVAEVTAEEMRAVGVFWSFSPNLDIPQDIRWGRVYETFSSDTALVTELGKAQIEGFQGSATGTIAVLTTVKHYLGSGGTVWGTSIYRNYKIDEGVTPPDEPMLREVHLPPFTVAINAGVLSIMAGHNSVGSQHVVADKHLLTDVLKKELGFKGFIVSDWYSVYQIPGEKYSAAVLAINAGIDMVMLPYEYQLFTKDVRHAVDMGDISLERIDDAVRRILRAKFSLGLFERAAEGNLSTIGSKEHRALARDAVGESAVLLQNRDTTLPFTSRITHIVIAGSSAESTSRQVGAWTNGWQGGGRNIVPGATSIRRGIEIVAGPDVQVAFDADAHFPPMSERADIGIAVVGEKPYAEGYGDDANPTLSPKDLETIESLRKVSKKIVVILVSGRPLLLPPEAKSWDAIVEAWLPGSEGEGIADVLFGKKPFVGKLPLPWPATLNQLPFSPRGAADKTAPLFPIGFGLK